MCHNAIDRHVRAGKGSKDALIYDSPITNSVAKFTYSELQEKVRMTEIYSETFLAQLVNSQLSADLKAVSSAGQYGSEKWRSCSDLHANDS